MARQQKYPDAQIRAVVQAMVENGEEINPARVRARLGGGNVGRIKAIIDADAVRRDSRLSKSVPPLELDIERIAPDIARQVAAIVKRRWGEAWSNAENKLRDENDRLRVELQRQGDDAAAEKERAARLANERVALERECTLERRARSELLESNEALKAGVRNAESDLRAAHRIIETLERGQRLDREEVRDLQKRNEGLACEVAELRASKHPAAPVKRARKKRTTDR